MKVIYLNTKFQKPRSRPWTSIGRHLLLLLLTSFAQKLESVHGCVVTDALGLNPGRGSDYSLPGGAKLKNIESQLARGLVSDSPNLSSQKYEYLILLPTSIVVLTAVLSVTTFSFFFFFFF